MNSAADQPPAFVGRRAVREALGIVVGGAVAAICFLIVVQEGFKQGLFDLDTNSGLGLLFGATGEGVPRRGFLMCLVIGTGLAAVQRGVSALLAARPLWVRMLPMIAIVFGLWSFVLGPLLERGHPELAAGVFGNQAGGWATPVVAVSSLVFGLVVERVGSLVRDIAWWTPKHFDLRESLEEIFASEQKPGTGESLELTEQGSEDRRETPGG